MSILELDPSEPLQRAMYQALGADADLVAIIGGADQIFDSVSDSAVFPYVTIGDDRINGLDTACGSDSEVYSTIRCYSRAVGRLQAKAMANRVRFVLQDKSAFTVSGFRLSVIEYLSTNIITHPVDDDGRTTHAEVNFRFRIIPVAP